MPLSTQDCYLFFLIKDTFSLIGVLIFQTSLNIQLALNTRFGLLRSTYMLIFFNKYVLKFFWGLWQFEKTCRWHHTRGISRRPLLEMSAPEPGADTEEDRRSNARKHTDTRQSGRVPIIQDCFWFHLQHGPFYDWAVKLKQAWKKAWYHIEIFFREMKKQKCQAEIMYFCKVVPRVLASAASPSTCTSAPETARPTPPVLILSLLNVKMMRMRTFIMIHFT